MATKFVHDTIATSLTVVTPCADPAQKNTNTPELFSPSASSSNETMKTEKNAATFYKPRKMFVFSDRDICRSYTKQLEKLLEKHCPSKKRNAPRMIAQYPGREEELLRATRRRLEKRSASQHRRTQQGGVVAGFVHCISTTFTVTSRP